MALTQISTGMLASGDGTVDLNIDNGTFVVDVSTSRVGIGTSSPVSKLDIASGDLTISNSTNAPFINFVDNTTRSQSLARIAMDQVSGTAGQLLFSTTTGGTLAERMRIDSSGNVGIGTSSPRSILDLDGGSETQLRLQTTNSGSAASDGLLISLDSSTNAKAYIWNYENAETIFGTNNAERMRIDASGNVGIGTSLYPQKFNVLGTYENAGFYRDYSASGVAATYLQIGRKDSNGDLVSGVRISGGGDNGVAASHNGYFEISTRKAGTFVSLLSSYSGGSELVVNESGVDMDFRVESDSLTHALFVEGTTGSVGIGNSSPSSYFSNANNLVVGGATGANGITISGSTDTQIFFADGTSGADAYRGIFRFSHADNGFSFWIDAIQRMRIDSSGNVQIGTPLATHVGTSQLFINRGVNATAATSGTTQTGAALRLRGGNNAVLDMGMNGVDTWIQATDRANLANGYNLSLNPNGGKVGIGTVTPTTTIDLNGALLMRSNIGNIGLATITVGNGMNTATGGELEFIHQWTGTMAANDTIAFTYNALNWKSWWFEIIISSTAAYGSIFRAGGYNNNSSGHSVTNGSGAALVVSRSGQANTFTLTLSTTHIHPLIKIRYGCGGGEGPPQIARAALVVTS